MWKLKSFPWVPSHSLCEITVNAFLYIPPEIVYCNKNEQHSHSSPPYLFPHKICTDGPSLMMVQLNDSLTLWWCESDYAFSRNYTVNFEFLSFPGIVICMILSADAGPWKPCGHVIMRVNNPYTKNHCVLKQPFCLSFLYSNQ